MKIEKVIGIISIILGIFFFTTILQSVNCGIHYEFMLQNESTASECLGMDNFLLFLYPEHNAYKLITEALIIVGSIYGGAYLAFIKP